MERTLEGKKQEQYYSQASLSRFDESPITNSIITLSCDYLRKIFENILVGANGIIVARDKLITKKSVVENLET
jgi:hypothetical protein